MGRIKKKQVEHCYNSISMAPKLALLALLMCFACQLVLAEQIQYFDNLPMDEELVQKANKGIGDLKRSLEELLTCESTRYSMRPFRRWRRNEEYEFAAPSIRSAIGKRWRRLMWMVRGLKRQLEQVGDTLEEVKETFIEYNNVVVGSGNSVTGDDNFVIGDYNDLQGNSNWIFASNVNSGNPFDGVLVVGDFLIELVDLLEHSKDIREVVHCTKRAQNSQRRRRWWQGANRRRRFRLY